MRLGLLDRVRRLTRLRGPGRRPLPAGGPQAPGSPGNIQDWAGSGGRHRRDATLPEDDPGTFTVGAGTEVSDFGPAAGSFGPPPESLYSSAVPPRPRPRPSGVRDGSARARIREDPRLEEDPRLREDPGIPAPRDAAATATRVIPAAARQQEPGRTAWRSAHASLRARLPFAAPHSQERPPSADGRRHCGSLERVLWRQWDTANPPPQEVVAAVDRLAELPERIKERLTDGLDAIFIGPGGVPELDDMTALRGVRLPSGHASWDACAGAYGERKIVVGSQPSPTPDVMCHEIGHALDDIDSPPGKWQSDSAQFRMLYDQCQPHLASDFHRQPGGLGRKEFFADAFAAIASGQRPALVDMLSGETRTALRVMLYFNRRYDI